MRLHLVFAAAALALSACGDSDQDKLGSDLSAAEGRAQTQDEANFAEAAEIAPPSATLIQPLQNIVGQERPLADKPDEVAADKPLVSIAPANPSFDCADAASRAENLICADDNLAALDRTMDANYARALDESDPAGRAALQRSGREFLAARNRCPDTACIAQIYRYRLREIADIMDFGGR